MANAVRKIAEYLGLVDNDGYEPTYTNSLEQVEEARTPLSVVNEQTPAPAIPPVQTINPYQIISIQPTTFNDARRIGEEFRSGSPVILNLSDLEHSDAVRLVDFSAGLVHGLKGSIEKVAKDVFLLSPANIDVSQAARAQLNDEPFYNQR